MLEKLSKPLSKEDIELRVASCNNKGFSLILYKTARTDVNRLNDVCGLDWKNEHFYDKEDNLCCRISVYDKEKKEWVTREDVGTESFTEKEKGSYSDSFKRAGFRFGIGIELYTAPFIHISGNVKEEKGKYLPDLYVNKIEVSEYEVINKRISKLTLKYNNKVIFSFNKKITEQKEEPKITADEFIEEMSKCTTLDEFNKTKINMIKDYSRFTVEEKEKVNKACSEKKQSLEIKI